MIWGNRLKSGGNVFKRQLKYNLIKFLRLKGSPSKLALGFAVGACVNFYPTFGFGVPLAGLAAGIILASIPAGLLGDIIFKPLFPVFFYLNLLTGHLLWTSRAQNVHHVWKALMDPKLSALADIGKVFFTGAIVNSIILGTILYIFINFIVERYRLSILKWLVSKSRGKRNCA